MPLTVDALPGQPRRLRSTCAAVFTTETSGLGQNSTYVFMVGRALYRQPVIVGQYLMPILFRGGPARAAADLYGRGLVTWPHIRLALIEMRYAQPAHPPMYSAPRPVTWRGDVARRLGALGSSKTTCWSAAQRRGCARVSHPLCIANMSLRPGRTDGRRFYYNVQTLSMVSLSAIAAKPLCAGKPRHGAGG